jgi:hypothetical protein
MNYFEKVKKELYKFENLGIETTENGAILIGKAPHIGAMAWLNELYPILNDDDITILEQKLNTEIPVAYKFFLMNYSNGLNVFVSTFYLDGIRKQIGRSVEASRQPYSIITTNTQERPKNAKDNYFFIGGYNWDGSHLYIDKETNKVHCCDRYDATSLSEWNSFEEMIVSEIKRIGIFFDSNGVEIDEDFSTLPY